MWVYPESRRISRRSRAWRKSRNVTRPLFARYSSVIHPLQNLEAPTRRLALELLVEIAERGPGMIKKTEGLIQQLIAVAFAMMVESVDAGALPQGAS
jgi:hypothetical protein